MFQSTLKFTLTLALAGMHLISLAGLAHADIDYEISDDGVLEISTSNDSEYLDVAASQDQLFIYFSNLETDEYDFVSLAIAGIEKIEIDVRGGDDTVWVDYRMDIPCVIYGGNGNDNLGGGAANDILYGEDGDDRLYGGKGSDYLYGDDDDDKLFGGEGDDFLFGGDDDDELFGDDSWNGVPTCQGIVVGGLDFMDGEDGNDIFYGGLDGNIADIAVGGQGVDCVANYYALETSWVTVPKYLTFRGKKVLAGYQSVRVTTSVEFAADTATGIEKSFWLNNPWW